MEILEAYADYFDSLKATPVECIAGHLQRQTEEFFAAPAQGDYPKWRQVIESLPGIAASSIDLCLDAPRAGLAGDCGHETQKELKEKLMLLHPWRKGPFEICGVRIETEWRSDLKWARLGDKVEKFAGRNILDVGSGNGYYALRSLGAGANTVTAVDPFLLYVMQFVALNRYFRTGRAAVLPVGVDEVPRQCGCFDTVMSMGVLYHRRDPMEHLQSLYGFVRGGGKLILETLVLDKPGRDKLTPDGRYAKMRNVFEIPTPSLLVDRLGEAGFVETEVIDITKTTTQEQRATEWMTFESLPNFLDPADDSRTIEGYPAPVRAMVTAKRPG